jgi:cell division protein FtsW
LLLILLFLGLTSLASASGYFSLSKNLPLHYFVKRQALFAVMGLVIGLIVQPLPLDSLVKLCAFPFILLSYALMFLTLFTPLGLDALGARRWISIGPLPSFQPSEVVKIATVFFIPLLLKTQRIKENIKDYLSLALILSFALLILMQRDYSTAALYLVVSLVYALVVGVSMKRFLKILIFLPVPALGLLLSEQYRLLRLVSFFNPSLDQQGINYQMAHSLGALARGGFWGKGVGQGVYKLGKLPEVHNDFIISSIGEETGVLGLAFICLLFLGFAYFGLKASTSESERGNMLSSDIILGFTLMIVFQVIVNLYVCIGLLPPTGIPLPFFSQGGTNLLLVLVESSLIYKSLREGENA